MIESYFPTKDNPLVNGNNLRALSQQIHSLLDRYVTVDLFEELKNALNKALIIQPGVINKADLVTKSNEAETGWMYIVGDDDNHLVIFVGKESAGQNGVDENGFYDLGFHIDMSAYATAESVNGLTSQYSTLDTKVSGIDTKVSGIETTVSGIQTDVSGVKTNMTSLENRIKAIEDNVVSAVSTLSELVGE